MSNLTLGDMAQTFQLRRDTVRLKTDLMRMTNELSTGRKADISSAVAGDFGPIVGIDRQLETLKAYGTATTEASVYASAKQLALDKVQAVTQDLGPRLIAATSGRGDAPLGDVLAFESGEGFAQVVRTLNTQAGGRALFAGAATDRAALAEPETMLAELRTLAAAETTADGVAGVIDAWFAPGGGFETGGAGYTGSTTDMAALRVGGTMDVDLKLRADDPVLRETLKGLAMAAIAADGPLNGNETERVALAAQAGRTLLQNQPDFTASRALVGTAQAAIDKAAAQNAAETTALSIARNDLTSADPYQTAIQLRETETQLETLYTMTARLSRLKLLDFIR